MSQVTINRYAVSTAVFALISVVSLIVFIAMLVTTGDGQAHDVDKFTRDVAQQALAAFGTPDRGTKSDMSLAPSRLARHVGDDRGSLLPIFRELFAPRATPTVVPLDRPQEVRMSHVILNRYAAATVAFALIAVLSLVVFIGMLVTTGDASPVTNFENIPFAGKRSP